MYKLSVEKWFAILEDTIYTNYIKKGSEKTMLIASLATINTALVALSFAWQAKRETTII